MKILGAFALLLATLAPVQAQTTKPAAGNVTGKWTGTMTRTAPDGQTQSINFMMDLTQKGTVLTGTVGPNAERQWPLEKGAAVKAGKVTFWVQQPEGPKRTFTLALVKDRLQGEMLAEPSNAPSFTAKVDAGRAK